MNGLKDTDEDDGPRESIMPELTAEPGVEDGKSTHETHMDGTKRPCGRVVGIIRRHWREKQYCGSLLEGGDREMTSSKGQATSALFVPVDRKVSKIDEWSL